LKNNLATVCSDTGQFKDILSREEDHPLLYLHFSLLDDWHVPATSERRVLEKQLFLAMAFTFAAIYTQESILDESSNFGREHFLLAQSLTGEASRHLAHIFPHASPFWKTWRTFWAEYAEATVTSPDRPPETARSAAAKLAYAKIPVAAVALHPLVEQPPDTNRLAQLYGLMDRLNFVYQILQDISNLRRDLIQRRPTYLLQRAMAEAGLDVRRPVSSERLLGALVLTGAVEKIGQECLLQLDEARSMTQAPGWTTMATHMTTVADRVRQMMALFDLKVNSKPAGLGRPEPFFGPYVDPLPKVIDMAEGYLLADPVFRESWEVQRRGLFGRSELTAKAFPGGLIVEVLCRHGHDMAKAVDRIFETLHTTNFRYYDTPHMPPDADDVGLLLRLYPHSSQPDIHRQMLHSPLRWLKQNVRESGEIPVWFTQHDETEENSYQGLSLWGQSCAAVEANVLLGLLAFDFWGYRSLIEKSAGGVLDRLAGQGLGAAWHYVPLYSLWTGFELIGTITASPLGAVMPHPLKRATQMLVKYLGNEITRPYLTPQEAAFLILACLSQGCSAKDLFNPRWVTIICKAQRYDGSWGSEPLYGTPARGEFASWYASRSVTTAFCYHALKSYQAASSSV